VRPRKHPIKTSGTKTKNWPCNKPFFRPGAAAAASGDTRRESGHHVLALVKGGEAMSSFTTTPAARRRCDLGTLCVEPGTELLLVRTLRAEARRIRQDGHKYVSAPSFSSLPLPPTWTSTAEVDANRYRPLLQFLAVNATLPRTPSRAIGKTSPRWPSTWPRRTAGRPRLPARLTVFDLRGYVRAARVGLCQDDHRPHLASMRSFFRFASGKADQRRIRLKPVAHSAQGPLAAAFLSAEDLGRFAYCPPDDEPMGLRDRGDFGDDVLGRAAVSEAVIWTTAIWISRPACSACEARVVAKPLTPSDPMPWLSLRRWLRCGS